MVGYLISYINFAGHSKLRAFWYGQLSGMVEPFAAVLGAALVVLMEPVLPYALAFAAGAMIYVVVGCLLLLYKDTFHTQYFGCHSV